MVYDTIRSRTPSRKPFRIPLFKRNWSACCAYGGAARDRGYNLFYLLYCSRKIIRAFVRS